MGTIPMDTLIGTRQGEALNHHLEERIKFLEEKFTQIQHDNLQCRVDPPSIGFKIWHGTSLRSLQSLGTTLEHAATPTKEEFLGFFWD